MRLTIAGVARRGACLRAVAALAANMLVVGLLGRVGQELLLMSSPKKLFGLNLSPARSDDIQERAQVNQAARVGRPAAGVYARRARN